MIDPRAFTKLKSEEKARIIDEVSALFAAYSTVAATVHSLIGNKASLTDEYMDTFYMTIHQIIQDLQDNKISDAVKKLDDVKILINKIRQLEAKESAGSNPDSLIENI